MITTKTQTTLPIDFTLPFLEGMKELPLEMYTPETKQEIESNICVYIMFNNAGEIIYVGESSDGRSRVMSHFTAARFKREIYKVGVFYKDMTRSERLALEAMLTRQYTPMYDRTERKKAEPKETIQRRISKGVFSEIRELLENSSMTNLDIARKYGVHRNTISNIQRLVCENYRKWELERLSVKGSSRRKRTAVLKQ